MNETKNVYIEHHRFYGTSVTADHVFETEEEHIRTGLLDSNGNPIVRKLPHFPLGFQNPNDIERETDANS